MVSLDLFSQIGINTDQPDALIQIKIASLGNDVRIDDSGNLGLSVFPLVKLHIETGGTAAAPLPSFILKDGYEANEKILTCDNNGKGIWKDRPLLRTVTTTLGLGVDVNYSTVGFLYTGTSIVVPVGTWMLHVVMLLSQPKDFGEAEAPESVWVRSTFAEQGTLVPSSDIVGSSYISGLGWKNSYGLMQGFIIIKNGSAVDKVYDYVVGNTQDNGVLPGHFHYLGGGWAENNIVGYQIDVN